VYSCSQDSYELKNKYYFLTMARDQHFGGFFLRMCVCSIISVIKASDLRVFYTLSRAPLGSRSLNSLCTPETLADPKIGSDWVLGILSRMSGSAPRAPGCETKRETKEVSTSVCEGYKRCAIVSRAVCRVGTRLKLVDPLCVPAFSSVFQL